MENALKQAEHMGAVEQDLKSVHRRLDNLEKLTESVYTIANEIKAMRADVNDITERVNEIEKRPRKWYDVIVTAVITTVVGIVIGYFLK